jgi:hypothetical protein
MDDDHEEEPRAPARERPLVAIEPQLRDTSDRRVAPALAARAPLKAQLAVAAGCPVGDPIAPPVRRLNSPSAISRPQQERAVGTMLPLVVSDSLAPRTG